MRTTACTRGALRILTLCAEAGDGAVTMPEMAAALGMTEALVVKACHRLMRAGYLNGVRGRGGGYRLGRPAASVSLIEVVRLFEDRRDLFPCGLSAEGPCRVAPVCRLRRVCEEAYEAFCSSLAAVSIAEIAALGAAPVAA